MKDMTPIVPPMATPQSVKDLAFFEMGGMRYLVMPLGPAPSIVEDGHKAAKMPTVPVAASSDNATVEAVFPSDAKSSAPQRFVYGLKGIQELFHCSKSTAYNIKRSGKIDDAISQIGNTIVVDTEKALDLLKK